MNNLKFRAWHKTDLIMLDVCTMHLKSKLLTGTANGRKYNATFNQVELMQSTGKTDKNGKEVFIGDIIKARMLISMRTEITAVSDYPIFYEAKSCEIIGNIHENPELLG